MNETERPTGQTGHGDHTRRHGGGTNVMGVLMAAGTAVVVAVLLVPSIGLLFGVGAGLLAGAWMFAMHGGGMCGHGGHGDGRSRGC